MQLSGEEGTVSRGVHAPRFADGASPGNACSKFVVVAERADWESLLKKESVLQKCSSLSCGIAQCTLDSWKKYKVYCVWVLCA